MNGYDLAQRLRELPPLQQPYLVAVTGYGQSEDRGCSGEVGFALHLVKPVEPVVLEGVLRAVAHLQHVRG
jgi:two-component system CheB/CheR fusion protein